MSVESDPSILKWVGERFYDGAAYLVAILVGLVYTQAKAKSIQDKAELEKAIAQDRAELRTLRELTGRLITREDFEKHEQREDKDRDERRGAEQKLFDGIEKVNDKLSNIMTGRRK